MSSQRNRIRPGEKIHEILISENEAIQTIELPKMFIIKPIQLFRKVIKYPMGNKLPDGYQYTSKDNSQKLSIKELKDLFKELEDDENK